MLCICSQGLYIVSSYESYMSNQVVDLIFISQMWFVNVNVFTVVNVTSEYEESL